MKPRLACGDITLNESPAFDLAFYIKVYLLELYAGSPQGFVHLARVKTGKHATWNISALIIRGRGWITQREE